MSNCQICGEPMPSGEEMFNYHGYSGPCPKPPKPKEPTEIEGWAAWHPEQGFGMVVNLLVERDVDDAINDAKAAITLDDDPRWKAVKVKVTKIS